MPPTLDDYIGSLTESRTPEVDDGTKLVSLSAKVPEEVADWLKELAKEIGVPRAKLVSAVFNDGLDKLRKSEAKLERGQ